MLAQIKTENGVKKIIRLTADAGAGNPVGTIIPMYKKSNPSGYLYCDGSTFDQTKYPLLYAYLGSNVLPDYREFGLVGAEENTTDVYNASTNPNGTIHDHDIYTEGQAKDDQGQKITGKFRLRTNSTGYSLLPEAVSGAFTTSNTVTTGNLSWSNNEVKPGYLNFDSSLVTRAGTTTRGKRKAVYFYIKATSGLTEGQQDDVANLINGERSYSTDEINTGKKWIDNKPIYRKCYSFSKTVNGGVWTLITNTFDISFSQIIKAECLLVASDFTISLDWIVEGTEFKVYENMTTRAGKVIFYVEYTKTTD